MLIEGETQVTQLKQYKYFTNLNVYTNICTQSNLHYPGEQAVT